MVCSLRIAAILRTTNGSCGERLAPRSLPPILCSVNRLGVGFLGKGGNPAAGYSFVRPPRKSFPDAKPRWSLRLREKHPIAARSRGMIRRDMGFFPGKGKTFIKVEVGTSPFYMSAFCCF